MIEELTFDFHELGTDDAMFLIRQLNALKRFKFIMKDQTESDRFVNQLDAEWKVKVEPYFGNVRQIFEITRSIE